MHTVLCSEGALFSVDYEISEMGSAHQSGMGTSGVVPSSPTQISELGAMSEPKLHRVPDDNLAFVVHDMPVQDVSVVYLHGMDSSTDDMERAAASQNRRWSVTFLDSRLLAIGEAPLRFPTHDMVYAGALYAVRANGEAFPRANAITVRDDNAICGFIEGLNNYIIRIEDHSKLIQQLRNPNNPNRDADRKELQRHLDMYAEAIEINAQAARDCPNSQIVLLLMGEQRDDRLVIPKMLGRLHQTSLQRMLPGPTFIKDAVQVIQAGKVYYSESQRIRFISPDQTEAMTKLLEESDPSVFMRAMYELKEMLRPTDPRRKVEARFLVIDPDTESPVESGAQEQHIRTLFDDLIVTAEMCQATWDQDKARLAGEIQGIASIQRKYTHESLRYDDLSDPEFVRIMFNILRTGGKSVDFGEGFSTPLKAVDVGHFQVYQDGTREFVHSSLEQTDGRIVAWAMKNVPGAKNADWLCLCKPEIPLTFDHHPSAFVSAFGDLPERSFVVLVGNVGEPEQRIVVRENQYRVESWSLRQTEKVGRLRGPYTDRSLTDLVALFQASQNDLCQTLSKIAHSKYSIEAEPFKPILRSHLDDTPDSKYQDGDLMYRRFYDGERLDLARLSEWTKAQIEGGLVAMGEVVAKSVIKQSPSLDFSSLVISQKDEKSGVPSQILSLSSSETFCNSLHLKDRNTYLRMVESLYASHVATWIESFLVGEHGANIPTEAHATVRRELREVFLSSFRDTFTAMTSPESRAEFSAKIAEIKENYSRVRKEWRSTRGDLPTILDMPRTLAFTEELLAMSGDEIEDYIDDLRHAIDVHCEQNERILRSTTYTEVAGTDMATTNGERNAVKTSALKEDVLLAVYSLTNNHFSADKFARIDRVISGKEFDLTPYSLQEKIWLFNFIDVAAWLDEIKFAQSADLLHAATEKVNVEAFMNEVSEKFPGSNLPTQSLRGFYHAVYGLLNMKDVEGDVSKKRTLKRNLLAVQDILGTMRSFRSTV